MKQYEKEMILRFALEGMENYRKELKEEFKIAFDTDNGDEETIADEISNMNKMIKGLKESMEKGDTEIVD